MSVHKFRKALVVLQQSIASAEQLGADLGEAKGILHDFKQRQKFSAAQNVSNSVKLLQDAAKSIPDDGAVVPSLLKAVDGLDVENLKDLKQRLDGVAGLASQLEEEEEFTVTVPDEIREHVEEDLNEISRCFEAGLYRSAVILCGRVLETALFSKYFHETGVDLLEKAPGTGLGNLIKKLAEKGIETDPALTNQIHLINQVRIHSVHQKKQVFRPSKEQTKAIILYTKDILNKLF